MAGSIAATVVDRDLTTATVALNAHYDHAAAACVAPSQRTWLEHKRRHSHAVLAAMDAIILTEPSLMACPAEERHVWRIGALFHDLGRADELVARGVMGTDTFGHAGASVRLIGRMPAWSSCTTLLLAVGCHSCRSPEIVAHDERHRMADGPTRDAHRRAVHLVRDADKLANLIWLASTGFDDIRAERDSGPLSAPVLAALRAGTSVLSSDVATDLDRIASFLGWLSDIIHPGTMRLLRTVDLERHVVDAMRRSTNAPEAAEIIAWHHAAVANSPAMRRPSVP